MPGSCRQQVPGDACSPEQVEVSGMQHDSHPAMAGGAAPSPAGVSKQWRDLPTTPGYLSEEEMGVFRRQWAAMCYGTPGIFCEYQLCKHFAQNRVLS